MKKILWASIWQSQRFMRNINTAECLLCVDGGQCGPKGQLNGNIWTSFVRTIWYSAYCGAAWMLLIWKETRSMIVSSAAFNVELFLHVSEYHLPTQAEAVLCMGMRLGAPYNEKVLKPILSCVVAFVMFCFFVCLFVCFVAPNWPGWGVNIFRDSRLCWSSFVICWKELTWTSIPKSKSPPNRLENNKCAQRWRWSKRQQIWESFHEMYSLSTCFSKVLHFQNCIYFKHVRDFFGGGLMFWFGSMDASSSQSLYL